MPDVLFYTEITNSSFAPTFNNLEGYVRGMLSVAYQSSWSSLARTFLNDSFAETTYQRPVPGLVAHLSKERVIAWCILNSLLALSAVLLYVAQRKRAFNAVLRPWLSALFLDARAAIERDVTGLCDARKLEEQDKRTYMKLVCHDEEIAQHAYKRPVMVKEDISPGGAYSERFSQLCSILGRWKAD